MGMGQQTVPHPPQRPAFRYLTIGIDLMSPSLKPQSRMGDGGTWKPHVCRKASGKRGCHAWWADNHPRIHTPVHRPSCFQNRRRGPATSLPTSSPPSLPWAELSVSEEAGVRGWTPQVACPAHIPQVVKRGGAWWGREGGWRRWEGGSMEQMSKSMQDNGQ